VTDAVLATRHGKLGLIAPALARVGYALRTVDVDTDTLGTFSGEVPRPGAPRDVAVAKARLAMVAAGVGVGVASEGTVGPSPLVPFANADIELVVLVDDTLGIAVVGRHIGHELRVIGEDVTPGQLARPGAIDDLFARAGVGGPDGHHLIVRPAAGAPDPVVKAVGDRDVLSAAVVRCADASPDGRARIETDLRAHLCPSRRPAIVAAADDLARRLASRCPACASPGWGVVRALPGRPCADCGVPTRAPRADVEACVACEEERERPRPDVTPVDPAQCDRCNP
jgi:hypothetical protein